jgi:hypothetical protein
MKRVLRHFPANFLKEFALQDIGLGSANVCITDSNVWHSTSLFGVCATTRAENSGG